MITVNINNTQKQIAANCNLQQVLEQFDLHQNGIAVAINNQIITKDYWSNTRLRNQDKVLIIKATQGG